MAWETVIGLEIHAQLSTRSKIFSGAETAYGAEPNTQACLVTLGYPGVLPVLNREAVVMAVRFGLAVGASVAKRSVFARKNYFYPDLPKGYQISQFELPIVKGGQITLQSESGQEKNIRMTRAHLEEDAGKSLHEDFEGMTGVDLNRAGTPLLEIVSEPDLSSAKEAVAYMRTVHQLVRYLDICDGNMQEGSFRCDANISVRPIGQKELGTRTELKNLNSFRFVEKAINFEVDRQIDLLESGEKIMQETRLYDSDADETRPMRSKEEANDYRYFPDPDLLPLLLDKEFIDSVRSQMPELPNQKLDRFAIEYQLTREEIEVLTATKDTADFFESVAKITKDYKLTSNWIIGDLSAALNRDNLDIRDTRVTADSLAGLLKRIVDQTISGKIAKDVFQTMWDSGDEADIIIESKGLKQITDSNELETLVDNIIADNPDQVEEFLAGKEKLLGYFVGQIMQASQGKANPAQVNKLLRNKLKS
ncbi:MAG: Asp-tRNA(Asn)/Glu-tRNA(Gln) amidotransferase subunit GatB [Pseudomonadota bacterium]|nr:Asp-tRNA(Asn)/Glu-tRNA(Gln) amidotransferase subunit GatB [Pseudomonadota bacterium]